jgi:hypothetical protein
METDRESRDRDEVAAYPNKWTSLILFSTSDRAILLGEIDHRASPLLKPTADAIEHALFSLKSAKHELRLTLRTSTSEDQLAPFSLPPLRTECGDGDGTTGCEE